MAIQSHVQRFIQHGQHSCTSVMAGSPEDSPERFIWTLSRGLETVADERAKLSTALDAVESFFAASIAIESWRHSNGKKRINIKGNIAMLYNMLLSSTKFSLSSYPFHAFSVEFSFLLESCYRVHQCRGTTIKNICLKKMKKVILTELSKASLKHISTRPKADCLKRSESSENTLFECTSLINEFRSILLKGLDIIKK